MSFWHSSLHQCTEIRYNYLTIWAARRRVLAIAVTKKIWKLTHYFIQPFILISCGFSFIVRKLTCSPRKKENYIHSSVQALQNFSLWLQKPLDLNGCLPKLAGVMLTGSPKIWVYKLYRLFFFFPPFFFVQATFFLFLSINKCVIC